MTHLQSQLLSTSCLALCALACGGPASDTVATGDLVADAALVVHGSIAPLTFVHDRVDDSTPQVAWSFSGKAGDVIAPDLWPTSTAKPNHLRPTLSLLGPKASGKRTVLATGAPRGADENHLAIDGFTLPRTGSYLILAGQAARGAGGALTLRLWSSASHAPRREAAQLDLTPRVSTRTRGAIAGHEGGKPVAWTDAEVDELVADLLQNADGIEALSDAKVLADALQIAQAGGLATAGHLARLKQGAASLVGSPAAFAAKPRQERAFALLSLGLYTGLVFEITPVTPFAADAAAARVVACVSALAAGWGGAKVDPGARYQSYRMLGAVYGYTADWSAQQQDDGGRPVWQWFSSDWFGRDGSWLGEQSEGASEPDDDLTHR